MMSVILYCMVWYGTVCLFICCISCIDFNLYICIYCI